MKHNMLANNSIVLAYCLIALFLGVYTEGVAQISFAIMPNQPPANIYSVVTDPTTGDEYACTNNSVIRSVNQGVTWAKTANVGMDLLNVLYFSPSGQLYAGGNRTTVTPYYGIRKYNKATNTWTTMVNSPVDVTAIVEDASSNLYVGTGSSGNIFPNPINFGTGMYKFDGTTWTSINTGMANLSGYSVLPFIKDVRPLSNGDIIAATYGNGVIKYSGGSWSTFGTGLSNQYVNCLYVNASNVLYVGTDTNVSVLNGTTWSLSTTGLPTNKPIRALVADATGQMYAGLGYYVYQKGSITGEIYYSANNGTTWQNGSTGFNSTSVVSLAVNSSGAVFAAACGIWKAASPNTWAYSLVGVSPANNTNQMVKNQQGDWFVICRNTTNGQAGSAGVFRSSDKGLTWISVNTGINCQKMECLFVDSYGWLWLSAKQFIGMTPNPAFGNPELYKSADNGATWTQETTIVTANDGYSNIGEDQQGRLFVGNSFGQYLTNLSSSLNHAPFDNTLMPTPTNGYKSYGFAVNSSGHIFHGTETEGLFRSTAHGAAGTFVSITNTVLNGPIGNVNVQIDPYTDYIFSGGTHGQVNGVQGSKNVFGSTGVDNGANMFPFNNLPDYGGIAAAAFDNRGNGYFAVGARNLLTEDGLYTSSFPWTSNSVFTRTLTGISTLSYYFVSFMTDDCGYLYGLSIGGAGLYKSNTLINTPLQSTLTMPLNNATNSTLTPTFNWTPKCMPDNFRLQIATDALFTTIVKDQTAILTANFTVPSGVLNAATTYYWRVYGVNAVGAGKWSSVNTFTTTAVLPLNLIDFKGNYNADNAIELNWQTANEQAIHHFIVEKSSNTADKFIEIGNIKATGNLNTPPQYYSLTDAQPSDLNYYRLKMVDNNGAFTYSKILAFKKNSPSKEGIIIYPNPANHVLNVVVNTNNYSTATVSLSDIIGRTLMTQYKSATTDSSPFVFNTEAFESGIYIATVIIDGNKSLHKVIIAK